MLLVNFQILRCGPPPMNKAMAGHLEALGYAPEMQFQFWLSSLGWLTLHLMASAITNMQQIFLLGYVKHWINSAIIFIALELKSEIIASHMIMRLIHWRVLEVQTINYTIVLTKKLSLPKHIQCSWVKIIRHFCRSWPWCSFFFIFWCFFFVSALSNPIWGGKSMGKVLYESKVL